MHKNLIIVFVKNLELGQVKTRLAQTIGDQAAYKIYSALVDITKKTVASFHGDKQVYFSKAIVPEDWENYERYIQEGDDLGQKMHNAFIEGFAQGYEKIVLIGSDLPSISEEIIQDAYDALDDDEVVLGPAEDGGYYLIGMRSNYPFLFENMPWSQTSLLQRTMEVLHSNSCTYSSLNTLNDIDTFEDLEQYPALLKTIKSTC